MISNTFWTRSSFWLGAFFLMVIAVVVALWQSSVISPDEENFTLSKGDVVSSLMHTTSFRAQVLEIKAGRTGQLILNSATSLEPKSAAGEQQVVAGAKLAEIKWSQPAGAQYVNSAESTYWRGRLGVARTELDSAESRYLANPIPENAYAYDDAIRSYNEIARTIERVSVVSTTSTATTTVNEPVIATSGGTLSWKVQNGSQVKAGDVIAVLGGQQVEADLPLSENDKKTLIGKRVIVESGSETVKGQITGVTDKGVLLNLEKQPAAGNFEGRMEVIFDVKENVLAVRKDLLQFEEGKWYAEVKGEGRKEVQVGVVGNEYIEIVSGLEEGAVITAPDLTEADDTKVQ